ncbi:MAG: thiopeptide maturation pyridine synthase [Egibacteraceae bacterium]
MNTKIEWHNVQVYYYDKEKDDLILDCVRPLFANLPSTARRCFFVRHWLRGPHLRLRFQASRDDFDRIIKPAINNQVIGWLAEHPSMTLLDEAALLPKYERLAKAEREPGPLSPLYPDNSIQYLPYDRRLDVLGSEAAASLLEDFYVATTDLAFAMLAHIRDGNSRLNLAIDLMWATAHAVGPPITRAFISYRSHSEGKIMGAEDPAALRSFFEQQYRTRAHALTERLGQVIDTLDGQRDDVPFVRDWAQIMRRLWKQAEPLIAAGSITLPMPPPGKWVDSEIAQHSPFHQALGSNLSYLERLRTNPRSLDYRVIVNCLYLHLTRLGLKGYERFLLGYLAAEAVEERFGVSAVDLVSA